MIHDLRALKQLDGVHITTQEKRQAGHDVLSSSEEEEDEDTEVKDNSIEVGLESSEFIMIDKRYSSRNFV